MKGVVNMYPNYQPNFHMAPNRVPVNHTNPNDERFIGGLAFPFLLGGVTGAALAPAFWNRPYPMPYGPIPYPYPMYRPYF